MDKPKCRVCEHKHWSSEPHVFDSVQEKVQPKTEPPPKADGVAKDRLAVHPVKESEKTTGQVVRNQRWREKNRDKYNAYMRKWRKKAK